MTGWAAGHGSRSGATGGSPPPTPPPSLNFPGDPGDGNYMIGYSLEEGTASGMGLSERLTWPGYPGDSKVSVMHDYSGNDTGVDQTKINAALAAGFIPSQSVKFKAYTSASIAAGTRDAAIDTAAAFCYSKRPHPIILCYWHEPGGDYGTGTDPNASGSSQLMKDYRDAYRRIVTRFRAAGVDNVAWTPILETPWNFAGPSVGG